MTEKYFEKDAMMLIDILFDQKLFKEDLTRANMRGIEELVGFFLQSRFNSHWKAKELFADIEKRRKSNL